MFVHQESKWLCWWVNGLEYPDGRLRVRDEDGVQSYLQDRPTEASYGSVRQRSPNGVGIGSGVAERTDGSELVVGGRGQRITW